jgi:hypothetical protein
MLKPCLTILFALLLFCGLIPAGSYAQSWQTDAKISTRYARVFYENDEILRLFNKSLRLGTLSYLLKRKPEGELSLQGQLSEKIDIIVERVKTILEMHPKNFRVDIKITSDSGSIRALYKKKYYRDVEFIAFYSPQEKAVYISADDAKSNIFAHEMAHAIIDQYFGVVTPVKIHEILAQYVDEHFEE